MRCKDDYVPRIDPPAILALEVEISRSTMNRIAIFAAIGIPEIWRYDERPSISCFWTNKDSYRPSPSSRALPHVPIA